MTQTGSNWLTCLDKFALSAAIRLSPPSCILRLLGELLLQHLAASIWFLIWNEKRSLS